MQVNHKEKLEVLPEYIKVLKQIRTRKKLKQEDIASKLGISKMGLSYLENGKRGLKVEVLEKWGKILGKELVITFKNI